RRFGAGHLRAGRGRLLLVVAVPQLDVVARVPLDVLELVRAHPAHGLGRHAHDQPACRHHLARRHQRAGADLSAFLDDGAIEHHGSDADTSVVLHGAGVNDGAVADRHAGAHDARMFRRDMEDGAVLHVGVPTETHEVVLVTAQHGHGPHAGARFDRHVADDLGGLVHERRRIDPRRAAGNAADHATSPAVTAMHWPETFLAQSLDRKTASDEMSSATTIRPSGWGDRNCLRICSRGTPRTSACPAITRSMRSPSTAPGAMALTRMLCGPSSAARP